MYTVRGNGRQFEEKQVKKEQERRDIENLVKQKYLSDQRIKELEQEVEYLRLQLKRQHPDFSELEAENKQLKDWIIQVQQQFSK